MARSVRNNAAMNQIENALLEQAKQQLGLAQHLCHADCREYHAAWPFLRIAGLVGGLDADRAPLSEMMQPLLQRPGLRVLVAGCADCAQLELVTELAGIHAPSITVIDRCATPLAACSHIAKAMGSAALMQQLDVLDMRPPMPFDLILCHSLLPFLDASRRIQLLRLFSRWLTPHGRLVLAVKLDPTIACHGAQTLAGLPDDVTQWMNNRSARAIRVLDALPSLQVGVNKKALFSAVQGFYRFMAAKPTPYASVEQLLLDCSDAGLMLRQRRVGGMGQGYPGMQAQGAGLASVLLELSATDTGSQSA